MNTGAPTKWQQLTTAIRLIQNRLTMLEAEHRATRWLITALLAELTIAIVAAAHK